MLMILLSFKTISSGVDYLGWIHFPDHKVLRIATKRKMFKNIERKHNNKTVIQSYFGLLRHGNTYRLQDKIKQQ